MDALSIAAIKLRCHATSHATKMQFRQAKSSKTDVPPVPKRALTRSVAMSESVRSGPQDWSRFMARTTRLAVGSLIFLTTIAGPACAAGQQFSCKGQVVQEMINPAVQPKPIDLNVTLSDTNKLSIVTGDGQRFAPRITSNNKIQLKFATKEFVGEYFYYTGDLFLIYNAGPLARLSCSRV
jgi:hypothetical protein